MYRKELETAMELGKKASSIILSHYANGVVAEEKIGIDNFSEPVSIADRDANRVLVDGLKDAFPEDAILSEEEPDDTQRRLNSQRVWIIDPIDGTSGFLDHNGDFAIHIGLADRGLPVVGVVVLPAFGITYYASLGEGAFLKRDGEAPVRMSVSDNTDLSEMSLAVSRTHKNPKILNISSEMGFGGNIERGSVGLKVGLIDERICDAYIHLSPRTKLWDICAPQIILTEAGGKLTDLWGAEYRYDVEDLQNWGGIVATNGSVHEMILKRLDPLLIKYGRLKLKAPVK
ncbi:MAG: 3'(2'),5'-bisphosphate nucleotidase CysQ [Acidobacteria bacterium]|nr:3'(2'),5'-bisphosphate nucleotidase CysQ [Acidobacteriota bacterium]